MALITKPKCLHGQYVRGEEVRMNVFTSPNYANSCQYYNILPASSPWKGKPDTCFRSRADVFNM